MEKTNFENLDIYKISESLADAIWQMAMGWGRIAQDTVGKQIIRSADGIGANISEGSGRGTPADNRRFLRMARGSLYETRHWLRRAHQRDLLTEANTKVFSELINELTPKLNAYIRKVDETARKTTREK
ncbi:MAG TPA: four helix bundle protein [Pyrinomonadaceae bacterium]|nr:four helix bundle protein [Acidobacteriota bacterium]HQZ97165.1 four helix bundle protein [Pyrinomonadaceae bacterium]